MNPEENRDAQHSKDTSPTNAKTDEEITASSKPESAEEMLSGSPRVEPSEAGEVSGDLDVNPEEAKAPCLRDVEGSEAAEVRDLQPERDEVLRSSVDRKPEPAKSTPSIAAEPTPVLRANSFSREQPPSLIKVAPLVLRHWTRRDVLLFGAGALAVLAGGGFLLPQDMLSRLGVRRNLDSPGKEWFLNRALRIDDDVAEALYSVNRRVPTYTKSQITPLRNNYNGVTPDPGYIPGWKLTLDGLASGLSISLDIRNLLTRFSVHEQITRLVCVEGWSAVAWWSGLRFDDLLHAYPPMSQAKWALVESSVNLDASGNPDPYFMSIDLPTTRHPQTLLATHFNGQPLTVDHGAPLRLLVPVKLGLKNVKAVTRITYFAEQPRDYWAERGYSYYDGL